MKEELERERNDNADLRDKLYPPSFAKVIKYDILMSFLILFSSSFILNLFLKPMQSLS
jgi:hypothetical protein